MRKILSHVVNIKGASSPLSVSFLYLFPLVYNRRAIFFFFTEDQFFSLYIVSHPLLPSQEPENTGWLFLFFLLHSDFPS